MYRASLKPQEIWNNFNLLIFLTMALFSIVIAGAMQSAGINYNVCHEQAQAVNVEGVQPFADIMVAPVQMVRNNQEYIFMVVSDYILPFNDNDVGLKPIDITIPAISTILLYNHTGINTWAKHRYKRSNERFVSHFGNKSKDLSRET
jgi:hypothetical protein